MKLIKKLCLLFVLCSLFMFCSKIKAINVLTPNWSAHTEHFPIEMLTEEEMLIRLILSTSATTFKDNFVIANVDAEQFINNSEIITNLSLYTLDGDLKNSIKIKDWLVVDIISTTDNIFLVTTDLSLSNTKLVKYDIDLNKQKETEMDIQILPIIEYKMLGTSINIYRNNHLYIMMNDFNVLEYDLELNLLKEHTDMSDEDFCNIYENICALESKKYPELEVTGVYTKDNYRIETGKYEYGTFILLYKDGKLSLEKPFSNYQQLSTPIIINDTIVVSALNVEDYSSSLLILDCKGNVKQKHDNILNGITLENNGVVLNYSITLDKDLCIKDQNKCLSGSFKSYNIARPALGGTQNTFIMEGGSSDDYFYDVINNSSDEYVAVGYINSKDVEGIVNNGSSDALIVKYDKNNNIIWKKNFGTAGSDNFYSADMYNSGEILAVGKSGSKALVVKYDKNGNELWKKEYENDVFNDVKIESENNFVLVGNNKILNLNTDGTIIWEKNYDKNLSFSSISITKDNSYITTANISGDYETEEDEIIINGESYFKYEPIGLIIKYDKNGNMIWQRALGDSSAYNDVIETTDGGYIAVGTQGFWNPEPRSAYIVKYDKEGNIVWKQYYQQYVANISGITETSDEGFVVVGEDQGSFMLKYDKDGQLEWEESSLFSYFSDLNSVIELSPENYVAVGYTNENLEEKYDFDAADAAVVYNYRISALVTPRNSSNGTYDYELKDDKVKITPLANEGYSLDKIIVKDINGNEIECTEKDGSYYFDYGTLTTDATIEVLFKKNTIIEEIIENPNTITFLKLGFIAVIIFAIYNLFISKKLKIKRFA